MKRRLLSGLLTTAIFACAVISARTAAACRGAKGGHRLDEACYVTCTLTGQDSEYCYYDCESTCSETGTADCLRAMNIVPI